MSVGGPAAESVQEYLHQAAKIIQDTAGSAVPARVEQAVAVIVAALKAGKPLLVCGNGGSASDAMHIAGELVGRFLKERQGLNCICLSDNPATLTALGNDYGYETVFARQVEAYGKPGGIFWGISTSGNSPNVVRALEKAKAMGMTTIGMTGQGGGRMAALSDILLDAASHRTPEIQQVHICLYHYICEKVEAGFVG